MPNNLITQEIGPVSRQSLGLLHEAILLPTLMYFDTSTDGSLAIGDTVNVRTPASFSAKEFVEANGIEIQNITEGSIPVVLDKILDVSVKLTSKELTLDVTNFGRQVTAPAMAAIAEGCEERAALLLEEATTTVPMVKDGTAVAPAKTLNEMAGHLNNARVPKGRRVTVVGTDFATKLRNSSNLLPVDVSGSSEALREATVTRLAGTTVYESSYVDPEAAFMFAPEAFVFVTRALETMGTSQSQVGSFEGVSIRTVLDYDITKKATVASWDVLTGCKLLSQARVVKTSLSAAATTSTK